MNISLKEKFLQLWNHYFGLSELPVVWFYRDDPGNVELAERSKGWNCFICQLARVRKGKSIAFPKEAISCGGGRRYLGFSREISPGFEYFLSCGNQQIEGERYKQSPALVEDFLQNVPDMELKENYLVFKPWDQLEEEDRPEVVVFFASPDVLSGLFTLANYDFRGLEGVIAPFGAGCASIVQYPLAESRLQQPRAILGMFDVSARPCVPPGVLSLAMPFSKLEKIIGYMEESFLITESWKKVRDRMRRQG